MTRHTFSARVGEAIVVLAYLGVAVPAWCVHPAPAARAPVPSDSDIAKSRQLIRAAYEADYKSAQESGEPAALLAKLRSAADSVAAEPAKKYAFLLEAEDIAAEHDDVVATLLLVDRRAELFELDNLAERSKRLEQLAGPKIAADPVLMEQATANANRAAAAERFDIASDSATLALKIAHAIHREQQANVRRKQQRPQAPNANVPPPHGMELIKAAQEVQARIVRHKKLFTTAQQARPILEAEPNAKDANADVAKYLCFIAGKWEQGLPHLKKSQIPVFSVLARDELVLKAPGAGATPVFELAGRWWEAADNAKSLTNDERIAVRNHAAALYADILPQLQDDLEVRVAKTRGINGRPIPVVADNVVRGQTSFTHSVQGNNAVITGCRDPQEVVVVPKTIEGRLVVAIGEKAFAGNLQLKRVVLLPGLARIGSEAFADCRRLSTVVIPEGVLEIGDRAFTGTALTTLDLPASLQKIGGVPYATPELASINVSPSNPFFKSIDGILYDSKETLVVRCPENRQKPVVLPETIRIVGGMAFHGCNTLEAIHLPSGLEEIGGMAFYSCEHLKRVAIPQNVKRIEAQTFVSCGRLTDVAFAEGLESIEGGAFWGCGQLANVKLPASLKHLHHEAFKNCPARIERSGQR